MQSRGSVATAAHRRGRVAGARCRRPARQRITRTTRMRRAGGMYLVLDVVLACARIVAANIACEHTVRAKPAADALAEQRHAVLLHAPMRTNTRHVRQRQRAHAHARHVHGRRTAGSAPGASVVVSTAMSGDRGGGGGADTYTLLPPLASAATSGGGGGGAKTSRLPSPLVYSGTGPTPNIPASADASKNGSGDSVRGMRCFV